MDVRFCRPEDLESLTDLLADMSRHYNGPQASSREVVRANLLDNILGELAKLNPFLSSVDSLTDGRPAQRLAALSGGLAHRWRTPPADPGCSPVNTLVSLGFRPHAGIV